jgi:hypothetical protein
MPAVIPGDLVRYWTLDFGNPAVTTTYVEALVVSLNGSGCTLLVGARTETYDAADWSAVSRRCVVLAR